MQSVSVLSDRRWPACRSWCECNGRASRSNRSPECQTKCQCKPGDRCRERTAPSRRLLVHKLTKVFGHVVHERRQTTRPTSDVKNGLGFWTAADHVHVNRSLD